MKHDENVNAAGDSVPASTIIHSRPARSIEARKNRLSKSKGVPLKEHSSRGHHRPGSANNGTLQDPDDGDNSSSGSEFDGGGDGAMDTNSLEALSSSILRKVRRVNGLSKADQEIVRLVGQHLNNIGLKSSAAVLMAEAGCRLDQPTAATFRKYVMNGDWSLAVNSKC